MLLVIVIVLSAATSCEPAAATDLPIGRMLATSEAYIDVADAGPAHPPPTTKQRDKRTMQRVIVTLKPVGYMPSEVARIAAVQDRVIAAVEKLGVTVERKYPNLPQMVLTVSPKALAALREHADVVSVHEDVPSPPGR